MTKVPVGVLVGVMVPVAVADRVEVPVREGVLVEVLVVLRVAVAEGEPVAVAEAVAVALRVGLSVALRVSVSVAVADGVALAVREEVLTGPNEGFVGRRRSRCTESGPGVTKKTREDRACHASSDQVLHWHQIARKTSHFLFQSNVLFQAQTGKNKCLKLEDK